MKTYEFEVNKNGCLKTPCGSCPKTERVDVKLTVAEMRTEENQKGLVLFCDSGFGPRQITCAVLHPGEEDNFYRGLRYAINRLDLTQDVKNTFFFSVALRRHAELMSAPATLEVVAELMDIITELLEVEND